MKDNKYKILIFLAVLLTLIIRIYNIEEKNLWFDEVYSWNISLNTAEEIIVITAGDIHPPFFYLVLKTWTQIFSDSAFSMRMLTVLLSMLALIFIYKIARRVLKFQHNPDLKVALVILLYAFSPINVYYSQEVRMFTLNMLLCLGSVFYFFKFLLPIHGNRKSYLVYGTLYTLFTTLALYTHYFALLIIFTQLVIIAAEQVKRKRDLSLIKLYVPFGAAVFLFYLPWLPEFFNQVARGQAWRVPQSFVEVILHSFAYFKDLFFSYFIYYRGDIQVYAANAVTILIIIYVIFLAVKLYREKSGHTLLLFYISLFFFVPYIIAVVISINNSILLSRYLSILIPYFVIFLVSSSLLIKKKKFAYIAISLLLLVSVYGTFLNSQQDFKNNDYREIITYLENNSEEGDKIVAEPHYMGWVIKYHAMNSETNLNKPEDIGWKLDLIYDSLKSNTDLNNLWLIIDYSSMNHSGYQSVPETMLSFGFNEMSRKEFALIPDSVTVYKFRRNVTKR